jgi:hypothetical protein
MVPVYGRFGGIIKKDVVVCEAFFSWQHTEY